MEIVVGGAPCQDQPGYYYLGAKRDLCWRPLVLAQLVPCGILAGREATGGHSAQVTPPESWHFSIHSIEHGKGARMWHHHHTRKTPNHITICNLIEIVCNQPYPKGETGWAGYLKAHERRKAPFQRFTLFRPSLNNSPCLFIIRSRLITYCQFF